MENDWTSQEAEHNQKHIAGLLSQLTAATKEQGTTINKYQELNKQLRSENEKKEKEANKLREEVGKLKEQLRSENEKKEKEVTKLREEVGKVKEAHKKEMAQLREGIGKVKEAHKMEEKDGQSDLHRKLITTENMLQEAEKANNSLKHEKRMIENTFQIKTRDHECELSNLRQTLKKRDEDLERLNKQSDEQLNEKRGLHEKLDTLNRQNHGNIESLCRVQQERDAFKQQIDDWVKQKHTTVHVQMYAAVNKELCEKMMNELEDMLSLQFELNNSLIQVEKYKQPPDDSSLPLIVLCINASRLGTDVNQALHNVSRSRTVAVIVLHHKEIHALPRQPSEKLLIGSDYKHIALIVDIAYLTTKGIYPCDMNEKSLDRLMNFIKSNFQT